MSNVIDLNEESIQQKAKKIREKLVTLSAYKDQMTKVQVIEFYEDIINQLLDILEMTQI